MSIAAIAPAPIAPTAPAPSRATGPEAVVTASDLRAEAQVLSALRKKIGEMGVKAAPQALLADFAKKQKAHIEHRNAFEKVHGIGSGAMPIEPRRKAEEKPADELKLEASTPAPVQAAPVEEAKPAAVVEVATQTNPAATPAPVAKPAEKVPVEQAAPIAKAKPQSVVEVPARTSPAATAVGPIAKPADKVPVETKACVTWARDERAGAWRSLVSKWVWPVLLAAGAALLGWLIVFEMR